MAVLLAAAAAGGWGASDFLGGVGGRQGSVLSIVALSELIGAAIVAPLAVAHGLPHWNPRLALAAVAGVSVTVELGIVYYCLSIGAAFITAPVGAGGAVLAVTAGLIGGDRLSVVIAAGLAIAIAGGALCAAGHNGGRGQLSLPRAITACLIAATATATTQITLHAAGRASPYYATGIEHAATALSAGIAVLISARARRRRHQARPGPHRQPLLLGLLAASGTGGDLAFAASTGALSTTSAIASLYPVPTIAFALVLQHQRASRVQTIGIILALTGATILAAASG